MISLLLIFAIGSMVMSAITLVLADLFRSRVWEIVGIKLFHAGCITAVLAVVIKIVTLL